jgi:sulfatase maturation enzyme AslB (radical SAM superfamily)
MINIKWLQVEASTKCNAWCSACARNKNGYELIDNFEPEDLDTLVFENHLKNFNKLEVIDFCGTFGDAIAAYDIKILTEISKRYAKKIIIRTNGSLRSIVWWTQFANLLKGHDHEVWFCLDGLADTHAIYRQGTDFDKIINNARAFMSAGGCAVWQFIPWKHNEHQIKDCIKLSRELGFSRFEFVKDVRAPKISKHYQTGAVIDIQPWTENNKLSKYVRINTRVDAQDCRHLTQPSVYLNANGKLSVCCFMNTSVCVDTLADLPDIKEELANPRRVCLQYCGK